MINRLVEPSGGQVLIDGTDVATSPPHELRRRIGYAFQQIGLFPHLTIGQNIGITLRLLGWDAERIRRRVDDLLALVELDPATFRERAPTQLSGGQQQRVGVARALAAEPAVLLFDEPFGALDPLTRDALGRDCRRLHNKLGLTTVMITHDMLDALLLADRVVVMRAGRIIADDTPRALAAANDHGYVQELMEAPRRQADELRALMRREQR
jgi:osmoprotectant transport system ATP-binding protein